MCAPQECDLDPETDVRVLVMAWKLKSKAKPGEIRKEEFQAGMSSMGCDSVEALKAQLPTMDPGFMEHKEFRDFYRFCFQFNREGTQRTIEKVSETTDRPLPEPLPTPRTPVPPS